VEADATVDEVGAVRPPREDSGVGPLGGGIPGFTPEAPLLRRLLDVAQLDLGGLDVAPEKGDQGAP
jgi:hypothetical protein